MRNAQDPQRAGRFSISDIRRATQRARNWKLARDLGVVLLIWAVCAAMWLVWEWVGGSP